MPDIITNKPKKAVFITGKNAVEQDTKNVIKKSDFLTASQIAKTVEYDKSDIEQAMKFAYKYKKTQKINGHQRPLVIQNKNNHNKFNYLLYPGPDAMEKLDKIITDIIAKKGR